MAVSGEPVNRGRRLAAAGVGAVILAGAGYAVYAALHGYLAPLRERPPEPAPPAGVDPQYLQQAKLQLGGEERNLGTMRLDEERSAEFPLRNIGGTALEISELRTSCMCTFAQVLTDGAEGPLVTMGDRNPPELRQWKAVVEPGGVARIRVIYRPSLMPVQGPVARNVTFNTNDPDRGFVVLGIRATVQ